MSQETRVKMTPEIEAAMMAAALRKANAEADLTEHNARQAKAVADKAERPEVGHVTPQPLGWKGTAMLLLAGATVAGAIGTAAYGRTKLNKAAVDALARGDAHLHLNMQ